MHIHVKKLSFIRDQEILALPDDVFESLKLLKGVLYNICFGGVYRRVFIETCGSEGFGYFSQRLLDKLLLPADLDLNIWRRGDEVHLGPVVGIFVNTKFMRLIKKGNPPVVAVENMEASLATNSFSYYFTIEDIDWPEGRIKGCRMLSKSEKWEWEWFPIPDVVYDRGVYFDAEQKKLVDRLRRLFVDDTGIQLINSYHSLGKWELNKTLSKYPEINKYLPETILYEGFKSVTGMLSKYGFVFIKSSLGSRGKEVLSIENIGEQYRLVFNKKGLKEIILQDMEDVEDLVTNFVEGKEFVVQQGIKLIKYLGRNMDLRILIMKNEEGLWEAIKYYCRVAKGSFTITNSSAGGDVYIYENIYPELKGSYTELSIPGCEELRDIALEIASCIEKEYGRYGELGMDIGIDESGKVWFLEANRKPDKVRIEGVDDMEGVSSKALAVFKYAKYLAEGGYGDKVRTLFIDYNKNNHLVYYHPSRF